MRGIRSKLRDESGAAIVLVAVSMVALLSAVALAVDVGMLVTARTEAQRVSDLSALAGVGILAVQPDAEALARSTAIEFALLNTVQREAAVVLPEDVDVNLDSSTVTVRTIRTQSRGTPVGTFFARVFGVNSVDITATATAIAEPAGSGVETNCLLPIMLPDRWAEIPSNGGPWDPDGLDFAGVDDSFDPYIADPPRPASIAAPAGRASDQMTVSGSVV
ncbi:MAG: Tad domain-containing protein [Gemmatimonadota bacterium]